MSNIGQHVNYCTLLQDTLNEFRFENDRGNSFRSTTQKNLNPPPYATSFILFDCWLSVALFMSNVEPKGLRVVKSFDPPTAKFIDVEMTTTESPVTRFPIIIKRLSHSPRTTTTRSLPSTTTTSQSITEDNSADFRSSNVKPLSVDQQQLSQSLSVAQQQLFVPSFLPLLGVPQPNYNTVDESTNAKVNVKNPNFSFDKVFDVLNLYNTKQSIKEVGVRGDGNYGAGFGDQTNILYGLLNFLNNGDANFNLQNGLDLTSERGLRGFYTEQDDTNVNPLALSFTNNKKICIAEFFLRGLCFKSGSGKKTK